MLQGAGNGAGVTRYDAGHDLAAGTFALQERSQALLVSEDPTENAGLTLARHFHVHPQEIQVFHKTHVLSVHRCFGTILIRCHAVKPLARATCHRLYCDTFQSLLKSG